MPEAIRPYHLTADEGEATYFLGNLAVRKCGGRQSGGQLAVVEFVHPPGFAAPLHRHTREDEAFYVIDGSIEGRCEGETFQAGRGDFIWLPRGLAHTFIVGSDGARVLNLATPAGFEDFVAEVGQPATSRSLPPSRTSPLWVTPRSCTASSCWARLHPRERGCPRGRGRD
ncbi:cupin domain-containing protein [Krasilnikovia sp. M28-CT-15]|uniref:cupin domain-containing protein n=1 Tax=Krasilnikovia sp. M28-CT-15 TaxID=3373540 RepID=UPI003875FC58